MNQINIWHKGIVKYSVLWLASSKGTEMFPCNQFKISLPVTLCGNLHTITCHPLSSSVCVCVCTFTIATVEAAPGDTSQCGRSALWCHFLFLSGYSQHSTSTSRELWELRAGSLAELQKDFYFSFLFWNKKTTLRKEVNKKNLHCYQMAKTRPLRQ